MSMSERESEKQGELWIPTGDLARSPGHPFYDQLNKVLAKARFDVQVEELCRAFYKDGGRPSIAPGVYFRMLMIGYFEGLDSERGIAWRCADSLALRAFLGMTLDESTPDHSTLCRIRQRLSVEAHEQVFGLVLTLLDSKKLLRAKTVGIDGTTLEANAALRSIVRRDDGMKYEEYLKELAKASGVDTPTRSDLAKIDRKRPKKGSNDDWKHPHDPDSRITKMKDGSTHLAHKCEHAVDMDSGAVLAVTLHGGPAGDTTTLAETMKAACENVLAIKGDVPREWVADKGYHSNATMELMDRNGLTSYISEPDRGRRRWIDCEDAQRATYANRRRIRGKRGKEISRRRGEVVERSFAHTLESGSMRRTWLRRHKNILKRYLVQVAAFNLGLVMRQMVGFGTPRGLAGLARAIDLLRGVVFATLRVRASRAVRFTAQEAFDSRPWPRLSGACFSTAC